ncbi:MAG: hypothetical protein AB1752_09365 [Candidatus Zixiibacteriota bacterium]
MIHRIARNLSLFAIILVTAGIVGGCSSGSDGGSGASIVPANASSPELLERKYGYLLKEDRDFVRLAPNYSALRPFAPDTAIVVQHHSEATGQPKPAPDFNEFLHVRLNRAMSLRFVIADSTGSGLVVYEFNDLPIGAYTFGSKGWPEPQIEMTKGQSWVYVYVVADTRFRYRTRFAVNSKGHLVPLTDAGLAS